MFRKLLFGVLDNSHLIYPITCVWCWYDIIGKTFKGKFGKVRIVLEGKIFFNAFRP